MKLIFMGTPGFAVPTLERLHGNGHDIVAVFTQPDRPKGRGQHDAMPPVKEAALRLGLPVHQPERVRRPEVVEQIRAIAPDSIVVVGYGQIIPKSILDIPPKGIINVHASLLPKYRGAAPIQWAIAHVETRTGVTTMRINEGLDTGDMLLKWETEIAPNETAPELSKRLADAGADLAVRTMTEIDTIVPEPQVDSEATLAPILKKEDGRIDWTKPAREILNRMRGFDPWPGAYSTLRGQKFQVWKASVGEAKLSPGALRTDHKKLYVGCGTGESIELMEIQLEGKKRMAVAAFLNGFKPSADETLGVEVLG